MNRLLLSICCVMSVGWWGEMLPAEEAAVEIGSRLELLTDNAIVTTLTGSASLEVQSPEPQEVVLVTDKPWEGNTSAYYTIISDGDLLRMYYRGSHYDTEAKKSAHPEVACYAESRDGIHWTKPDLDLVEYAGSKANNIIWKGVGSHNFTPFLDTNPACRPEARFKAFGMGRGGQERGLYGFQSQDGIRWSLISEKPLITKGAFDSQNLAFWDSVAGVYRDYHRGFKKGIRDIMLSTSPDFMNWSEPTYLNYADAPIQHLYTNAIRPYPRAPHLLIGFPTRYLPKEGERVEPVFMSSRDGLTFRRFDREVISQDAPKDRKGNRSNYMANGLVQLPQYPKELSVYATEAYYTGPDSRLRRFTYRLDGFVALTAEKGSATTRPLIFSGKELVLNYRTRPEGRLRVELQDADGKPLSGFALEGNALQGDEIAEAVRWKRESGNGGDVSEFAGRPVRVHFELRNADLFSFQFR